MLKTKSLIFEKNALIFSFVSFIYILGQTIYFLYRFGLDHLWLSIGYSFMSYLYYFGFFILLQILLNVFISKLRFSNFYLLALFSIVCVLMTSYIINGWQFEKVQFNLMLSFCSVLAVILTFVICKNISPFYQD